MYEYILQRKGKRDLYFIAGVNNIIQIHIASKFNQGMHQPH